MALNQPYRQPKPPTDLTVAANQSVVLSFDDPGDYDRATRGRIAQLDSGRITIGDHVVFDVARRQFVSESETPPDSVHPGLWRQARLNVNHGLFELPTASGRSAATTSPTSRSSPETTAAGW